LRVRRKEREKGIERAEIGIECESVGQTERPTEKK